jgi:signal transduction histidine kinase
MQKSRNFGILGGVGVENGKARSENQGLAQGPDRGGWMLAVCFGLLAAAIIGAVAGAYGWIDAENWYVRSLEVRQSEADLFNAVQAAETGQRGYLLTGDAGYLQPFLNAQQRLPSLEAALAAGVTAPARLAQVRALDRLIDAKMAELVLTVRLRQRGQEGVAIAEIATGRGRLLMEQIRAQLDALDQEERASLIARQSVVHRLRDGLALGVPLLVLLAALLGMLIIRTTRAYAATLVEGNRALGEEMERRAAVEERLRQAAKMEALGQLTGGVAHDFNNMLAIIIGNLELLTRRVGEERPELRRLAAAALEGAQRAASLTQRLLAFSRSQPLDPKATDINACVGGISEVLRRTLGETIDVETVLGGGLWRAFIDRPQLESAILNLAVNARDAMPSGGKLTLETFNAFLDEAYSEAHGGIAAGQYVLVAITDTGVGMSQETAARAFDPFFTTKAPGHGTGLGLSQVYGFVKQSAGHIAIYSEPGRGTTVKLYLPRDAAGRSVEADRAAVGPPAPPKGLTVLVVEDDAAVREVILQALTELDYVALEAATPAAALELLEVHPETRLLLTDVVMPDMNGRQLAEAAVARWPRLKVLYMTGHTRNAIVHNGVLDADAHLITKPFAVEELVRQIRHALSD